MKLSRFSLIALDCDHSCLLMRGTETTCAREKRATRLIVPNVNGICPCQCQTCFDRLRRALPSGSRCSICSTCGRSLFFWLKHEVQALTNYYLGGKAASRLTELTRVHAPRCRAIPVRWASLVGLWSEGGKPIDFRCEKCQPGLALFSRHRYRTSKCNRKPCGRNQ